MSIRLAEAGVKRPLEIDIQNDSEATRSDISPIKRPRSNSSLEGSDFRSQRRLGHPRGVLPKGNLLFTPKPGADIRNTDLGYLSALDDTLVLHILSLLPPRDVLALAAASRALLAYAFHEPLWKDLYIARAEGNLKSWQGNWRKTYLADFAPVLRSGRSRVLDAADSVRAKGLYSDVLYQPTLCAQVDIEQYFNPNTAKRYKHNIPYRDTSELSVEDFVAEFAEPSQPVILRGGMNHWRAYAAGSSGGSSWSRQALLSAYSSTSFRAEALDCSFSTYLSYADSCSEDDSPLYLFDSRFVETTEGVMGQDYEVPNYFEEDLFNVMGARRPDYRWLIVGPARSGSNFHKDPNHTSAWNAVVNGRKGWIMFPPGVLPPGVFVTQDESEVTAPLSISEWFLSYFEDAWTTYGPRASDPSCRGKLKIGVCDAGEIIYVPSGWWHLVVNLDFSVAVTQNYVSSSEIGNVLSFMRDKPDQISGFKRNPNADPKAHADDEDEDEDNGFAWTKQLFGQFCDALRERASDALEKGLTALEEKDILRDALKSSNSAWSRLKGSSAGVDQVEIANGGDTVGGFSFGFDIADDEDVEEIPMTEDENQGDED